MKKLIALLLIMVMVIAATACQAKPEAPKTEEMTEEKTEETMEETTEEAMDKLYIPVMAKGFQHQFWQAVKAGADAAAAEYGVEIYFDGPASETEIDAQVNMVKNEMAKNPKAMALAALSTEAVTEILEECAAKDIPVIGFDSGVPDDKTGAVKATASTNNENAAAIAAEKFGENEVIVEAMKNADSKKPVIIGCLSQDAVSASITGRTTGFVNKMAEIAEMYQPGKVSIEGHAKWEKKVAIFCSNEGAVTGFLSAVSDGEDLAEGGKYGDIIVAGFDAGAAQKNAVRNGWFYGSVTQDPYQIGYKAVEMAVMAAKGESVSDVDTGAQWYNAENIDDEMISLLVYD